MGLFSVGMYFLADAFFDFIINVPVSTLNWTMMYAISGLPFDHYVSSTLWMLLGVAFFVSWLHMVGAYVQNMGSAFQVVNFIVGVTFMFNGIMISEKSAPDIFKWVLTISNFKWFNETCAY